MCSAFWEEMDRHCPSGRADLLRLCLDASVCPEEERELISRTVVIGFTFPILTHESLPSMRSFFERQTAVVRAYGAVTFASDAIISGSRRFHLESMIRPRLLRSGLPPASYKELHLRGRR